MKVFFVVMALVLIFSCSYSQQDSVFNIRSGDTVTIWNTNVRENCASRFKFSINMLDSNGIVLTETDTVGPLANCPCTYDLSAVLVGLGAGHYTVDVFRQYLKVHFYPNDTTIHIGSTNFDVVDSSVMSHMSQFHQSDCKHVLAVEDERQTPSDFSLDFNYPNPFNPTTTIRYDLPHATHVTLRVFDLFGRVVATLVNETKQAGRHEAIWNASTVSSGVYFCRLQAGQFSEAKKLLLIR